MTDILTLLNRFENAAGAVKPLEWNGGIEIHNGQTVWAALAGEMGFTYSIWSCSGDDAVAPFHCPNIHNGFFDSLEAAKAAAQDDYEARIRPSLKVNRDELHAARREIVEAFEAKPATGAGWQANTLNDLGNPLHLGNGFVHPAPAQTAREPKYWIVTWPEKTKGIHVALESFEEAQLSAKNIENYSTRKTKTTVIPLYVEEPSAPVAVNNPVWLVSNGPDGQCSKLVVGFEAMKREMVSCVFADADDDSEEAAHMRARITDADEWDGDFWHISWSFEDGYLSAQRVTDCTALPLSRTVSP